MHRCVWLSPLSSSLSISSRGWGLKTRSETSRQEERQTRPSLQVAALFPPSSSLIISRRESDELVGVAAKKGCVRCVAHQNCQIANSPVRLFRHPAQPRRMEQSNPLSLLLVLSTAIVARLVFEDYSVYFGSAADRWGACDTWPYPILLIG